MTQPRITDNRTEWAKKVLAQSVPAYELDIALDICIRHATESHGFIYENYLKHLKPRLIASNWNKSVPTVEPLNDENSEINKIGREIAEMSDEEFEANLKNVERIFRRSKQLPTTDGYMNSAD